MSDEISLTIDGVQVKATRGTNVLQAAMNAGIYIPYLCYYPATKPYGACRTCLVEIQGSGGMPASCTTPVADGMVVKTITEGLVDMRRGVMDLLLSEHPHGCLTCHRVELCGPGDICLRHVSVNDRCVTCPKNERCELKDTVRALELGLDTPLTYNRRGLPLKVNDPFWDMDMNLCIVCGRCVRVCDEIRGDGALAFVERAGRSLIGTSRGTSLLESGCEFCGACIDVCPTGALVERGHKWDKAASSTTSVCPHCPVGCVMTLEVDRRNRVVRAIPNRHASANRGQACFKGKFGMEFVNSGSRFTSPMVRRDGALVETTWQEALDAVAQGLAPHRGDAFAVVASPRGTNEDNYLAQKFARAVMGTNNVDLPTSLQPELVRPLGDMLGFRAATNPIWDLEGARGILVVSSNMTEEQNVVAVPIKQAARRGATVIVIDQRETELTRCATLWLRPRPGSETALLGGMLKVIVDASLEDHRFVAESCDGVEELKRSAWAFDLLKVERITGLHRYQIRDAATLFAGRRPGAVLYGLETLAPELREGCVRALVNLALVTGNVGKPSTGVYPLFTGANAQGSRDVGCAPGHLPGYGAVADGEARAAVETAWGCPIPPSEGLAACSLASAIREGKVRALLALGSAPAGLAEAAADLDFLVVHATESSPLTELAHVVLPAASFAEAPGTYTNLERRVQLLRPAVAPRGEEVAGWLALARIAGRMGAPGFDHRDAEGVFQEIRGLVPSYAGITYRRLQGDGLQWPCPSEASQGTPVLGPAERKPRMVAMTLVAPPDRRDAQYPLLLARGRVLHQADRTMEIVRNGSRNAIRRGEAVELALRDGQSLGISDGDAVDVVSATGRLSGTARLTGPQPGLVSVTSLFGELAAELDLSPDPDPMLDVPGLPLEPVRVEKGPTNGQ